MMVLNSEDGLECEVHINGIRLEHVSEFKYLGCILDSLSVLESSMKHCLCLFLGMAAKKRYGKRRKD